MVVELTFTILFLIFGLAIGSFINALEYRIGTDLSIVKGRSICPKCKKKLALYDNIPVLSFILLGGKCRKCHKPISWQYPIVELITGVTFVAVSREIINYQSLFINYVALTCLLLIVSCLLLVTLHDQKTAYVLSSYVYAAIVFTLAYLLINYSGVWNPNEITRYLLPNILSAVGAMFPFAALYLISKGTWMGAGDIEIAAFLGFFLGWPNTLVALYFAFITGSIWGLILIAKHEKGMRSEIPFGPFLIAGTMFAYIWGAQIVSTYVTIFLG